MLDDLDNPLSPGTSRTRGDPVNRINPGTSRTLDDRGSRHRPLTNRQIGRRISPAINRKQIVPQLLLVIDRVNRH